MLAPPDLGVLVEGALETDTRFKQVDRNPDDNGGEVRATYVEDDGTQAQVSLKYSENIEMIRAEAERTVELRYPAGLPESDLENQESGYKNFAKDVRALAERAAQSCPLIARSSPSKPAEKGQPRYETS